jgi:hypothetical protein
MERYSLPLDMQLRARRDLLAKKIDEERHAMEHGGGFVAAPREYRKLNDRTREQRLADWN